MKRKIPTTMATQHPDHAGRPYWHDQPYISIQYEAEEAYLALSELNIGEYKWDWEGKLVDESVLERFFGEHYEFFKKYPLGWEKFLTFRLPNPKVETEFRIGRALINLASAASVAKHFGFPSPPLFEVILPMTESAEEIISIQEAYQQVHSLTHPLYKLEGILTCVHVVPLFEQVSTIINSDSILREYVHMHKKLFKKNPEYLRPYVARSDPALNSGLVPTVLAIKIALSRYESLSEELGFPLYPVIGAAVLPFRGGIDPLNIEKFADEYKGIRTTTIQSAFRYDFKKEDVIRAIKKLDDILPLHKATEVSKEEENELISLIPHFEKSYKEVIEEIAPLVNKISSHLPKRRERVQHVGLFGYSRGVGKVKLPRAIAFTGSLYSIGIPPELIGTGRGLMEAREAGKLDLITKHYKYLQSDIEQAGRYLNKQNLEQLSQQDPIWGKIKEDVKVIEDIFEITLGPLTYEEREHEKLSRKILENLDRTSIKDDIVSAALLRKSLG